MDGRDQHPEVTGRLRSPLVRIVPWLAILAIALVTIVSMRLEGRLWYCAKGDLRVWITNVWSPHCSQHPFDPYSLTHISHGLIFYFAFALLLPRAALPWRLAASLALAAG